MATTFIKIEATRAAYRPEDVIDETITMGELAEWAQEYPEDWTVILSHDNGYTYGPLKVWDAEELDTEE